MGRCIVIYVCLSRLGKGFDLEVSCFDAVPIIENLPQGILGWDAEGSHIISVVLTRSSDLRVGSGSNRQIQAPAHLSGVLRNPIAWVPIGRHIYLRSSRPPFAAIGSQLPKE